MPAVMLMRSSASPAMQVCHAQLVVQQGAVEGSKCR
jgi:hypothetical protein